jgi:hypothetical protein
MYAKAGGIQSTKEEDVANSLRLRIRRDAVANKEDVGAF